MVDFWIAPSRQGADATRLQDHLRKLGLSADAIHDDTADRTELSEKMARGPLPLACVLSADIEPPAAKTIETILSAMHQQQADIAAPKIVSSG